MVGGNSRADSSGCVEDKVYRIACGDVFEHNLQFGEIPQQWHQLVMDKDLLSVKDINRRIGNLSMYKE